MKTHNTQNHIDNDKSHLREIFDSLIDTIDMVDDDGNKLNHQDRQDMIEVYWQIASTAVHNEQIISDFFAKQQPY